MSGSGDYISREAAIDAISEWLMKALHPENTSSYNEGERAAYRTALSEIAELPAADVRPRWIPVSERLPRVNERVMACVRNCGELWVYDATRWNGKQWETEMEACYDYWAKIKEPVTHWMPLPEPPEEVLTGTDMRGGIRRDDAGNVIDWGITGPPGDVGKTEEE